MFTFHWSELLVVVVCGLALFFGLALLMLRRRNEILQKFLTPEEPHLEEEFFRVRRPKQEETPPEVPPQEDMPLEKTPEPVASEATNVPDETTARRGATASNQTAR